MHHQGIIDALERLSERIDKVLEEIHLNKDDSTKE